MEVEELAMKGDEEHTVDEDRAMDTTPNNMEGAVNFYVSFILSYN